MKLVADSHIILWFVTAPKLLSEQARSALLEAEQAEGIGISAASIFDLWYSTQKAGKTRIEPARYRDIIQVIEDPEANVSVLPITERTGVHADLATRNELPDPFDRLIVATGLDHGLPLVTVDKRIVDLGVVRTIS